MSEHCLQVLTTVDSRAKAEEIAGALVQRRLAACVQILGPIQSTYWWKGRIESTQEWVCIAKTTAPRYEELEAAIRTLHPYETPEIVALPITRASADYLRWLRAEVRPSKMEGEPA